LAKVYRSRSASPEVLAELMLEESKKKKLSIEDLVDRSAALGFERRRKDVEELYKAFIGLNRIIKWPTLTIVLDVPIKDVRSREIRRENRAYTRGDVLYSTIVSRVYRFLARKEPKRIYVIDGAREEKEIGDEIFRLVKKKCRLDRYRKRRGK
jgi:thymidylate kinase